MWLNFNIGPEGILYLIVLAVIIVGANFLKPYYKRLMGDTSVPDQLSRLKPEYRVLNGIDFPARMVPRHIDHVVVSPYGIFVIKTMSFNGIIKGADEDKYWSNTVNTKTTVLENPVKVSRGDVGEINSLLSCGTDRIFPLVVFSNAAILKGKTKYNVINLTHMLGNIKRHKDVIISDEEIAKYLPLLEELVSKAPADEQEA